MNKYFKDRMDEIELREEQMAERKTYELEINSLEDQLNSFENEYQRLKTTCKTNLEQSALKQVDLVVAKEAYAFAKAMIDEKQALLVEEKLKLNNLHWQMWEEQMRVCDDVGKCLEENDSVSFLNEYPRVLKSHQKGAYLAMEESDCEIKKLVAEHPEIKQLTAEVRALETEIKTAEDSCSLSDELQTVLTETKELKTNDDVKIDETHILIEALEASHRERMSLEAEIAEIENYRIDVSRAEEKPNIIPKDLKICPYVENEPEYYTAEVDAPNDEKNFENELESYEDYKLQCSNNERDKKLKARKWYEEYAREITAANEENILKCCYAPVSHWDILNTCDHEVVKIKSNENRHFLPRRGALLSEKNRNRAKSSDHDEFEALIGKVYPKRGAKSKNSEVKCDFLNKKTENLPSSLTTWMPKRNLKPEKKDVDVEAVSQGTPSEAYRKFEPLIATPSTFLESAAEVALDNYSGQSNHAAGPSASAHRIMKVQKSVRFTPKRPSNIGKRSVYRQTKLDDFDNFMLPHNELFTR